MATCAHIKKIMHFSDTWKIGILGWLSTSTSLDVWGIFDSSCTELQLLTCWSSVAVKMSALLYALAIRENRGSKANFVCPATRKQYQIALVILYHLHSAREEKAVFLCFPSIIKTCEQGMSAVMFSKCEDRKEIVIGVLWSMSFRVGDKMPKRLPL